MQEEILHVDYDEGGFLSGQRDGRCFRLYCYVMAFVGPRRRKARQVEAMRAVVEPEILLRPDPGFAVGSSVAFAAFAERNGCHVSHRVGFPLSIDYAVPRHDSL